MWRYLSVLVLQYWNSEIITLIVKNLEVIRE
jgi:hypothetical protein